MDFRNAQRTETQARVLPDGAASNRVFRDVPRDAASLASPGKRTRHGERGMKDTDHFLTGVPFTSAANASIKEHWGCAWRGIRFWARAKHQTGLERPHLWRLSAAQRLRGVAPAQCLKVESVRECFARAKGREISNRMAG